MNNIIKSRAGGLSGPRPRCLSRIRSRKRFAFTLIELLVVVAVIGLLAMLVFPSLSSIFGVARSTQCGVRLKEIGKAVALLETHQGRSEWRAMSWQSTLAPYLGGDRTGMVCPEYTHLLRMAGIEEGQEELMRVPLEDLAAFKTSRAIAGSFCEDMTKGPWVVKLSDANWNRARNDNYLNNSDHSNNFPRASYEDGSEDTADPYWLCHEGHHPDRDYKDVMVRVTLTGSGYLLEAMSGTTWPNWIVDKPDYNVLQATGSNQAFGSLEPILIEAGGGGGSYGMNTAAPETVNKPDSILVMDYNWLIATPNDHWSDSPHPDNSTVPVFARHKERINVVFMDGSVRMMDPDDINPGNINTEKAYWLP